jgi:flagellar motor switch protein FliM
MDKVLSQDEINALFSAMSSEDLSLGNQPEQKIAPSRKVANFDFHRADHISQDQLRSIHVLHENFGRDFASSLSAYLRSFVDVNLGAVEQVSYAAFVKSLADPTLFVSLGMRPLDTNIALELSPSLVYPMIDMILGGQGRPLSENRTLTEIELNIIEGVVKLAMRDLRAAWHPIIELDFFLEGKGTKAQMFQIVSPAETVIAIHIEIKFGDSSGLMNLCLPSRIVKMLRSKFDQQWNSPRQKVAGSDAMRISELLKPILVPVSSEIRSSKLTMDDLLKISVGDIIELNERIGDPVLLCVSGLPKFMGRVIQRRGKKAFEIVERVTG